MSAWLDLASFATIDRISITSPSLYGKAMAYLSIVALRMSEFYSLEAGE